MKLLVSIFTVCLLTGCSAGQVFTAIKTAADILSVVTRVNDFAEKNGSPAQQVQRVKRLYEEKDIAGALGELTTMVQALKEAGVEVPREIDNDLIAGLAAAYAIEQGMRALSGRNPDGSPRD